jgi:hypothetical protein
VDFGQNVYSVPLQYVDYCGELSGPQYTIKATGTDEDGYSDMELGGVNISYDCYKWRCPLGVTSANGGTYSLTAQLPDFCGHGNLIAQKAGYLDASQQVLDSGQITINMEKLDNFTFDVDMYDYQSQPPAHLDMSAKPLKEGVTALITLSPYNDSDFTQYRIYPFDNETDESSKQLQLLDDGTTYRLDIMLSDPKLGTIGGWEGNWTVTPTDMLGMHHITFHALDYLPVPVLVDDQYKLISFLDRNDSYQAQAAPTFSP